ncbi:hypothetical protein AG1IA_00964 [Rhizoctonia solani AG-1 IA]|uniref:Uncharacterized protein n=1 Tax=Thanatephorus cucumeris (strain AG1-IA) TaxID=983506 RepID=L8X8N6_THACA|nr:hypothetical protein AG1IA_00964 [Rhizoctonia solani AG-1 IA]
MNEERREPTLHLHHNHITQMAGDNSCSSTKTTSGVCEWPTCGCTEGPKNKDCGESQCNCFAYSCACKPGECKC